jgi:hypothetical protein
MVKVGPYQRIYLESMRILSSHRLQVKLINQPATRMLHYPGQYPGQHSGSILAAP